MKGDHREVRGGRTRWRGARRRAWALLCCIVGLAAAQAGAEPNTTSPKPPDAKAPEVPESSRGELDNAFKPLEKAELCPWHLRVDGDWIPYCRNLRLGPRRTHIRRAIIVLHGRQRNARDYYAAIERIAAEEGALASTIIVAPQFLTGADIRHRKLPSRLAYWSRDGWKNGHRALDKQRVASYEVVDRIIKRLASQNPNLAEVVIAGHSAGAQFAQRHAIGRQLDVRALGIKLRYVVSNPGSYMYLTTRRPEPTTECTDTFNEYMYGFEKNRVDYFQGLTVDTLKYRFAEYPVYLLLGDKDSDPNDTDQSCEARTQGAHRFARGKSFFDVVTSDQLQSEPRFVPHRLVMHVVRDVGHNFQKMFDSKCGRSLIFGDGRCAAGASFSTATSR